MPWAQRGQHRYYFRKRQVNGRVVRRFLGRGPEAHLAAALDARRQREREAARAARRDERQRWVDAKTPLDQLIEVSALLLRAALLGSGYHQHAGGHWRKRKYVATTR
jgi:hypothetical protein